MQFRCSHIILLLSTDRRYNCTIHNLNFLVSRKLECFWRKKKARYALTFNWILSGLTLQRTLTQIPRPSQTVTVAWLHNFDRCFVSPFQHKTFLLDNIKSRILVITNVITCWTMPSLQKVDILHIYNGVIQHLSSVMRYQHRIGRGVLLPMKQT